VHMSECRCQVCELASISVHDVHVLVAASACGHMCNGHCLLSAPRREHALRKRRSRSAQQHWQQRVAVAALGVWRQLAHDGASFRGVLQDVGQRMQAGLLSDAFQGWRDVVRAKHWKEAGMMR
jgi:hypothetical protein